MNSLLSSFTRLSLSSKSSTFQPSSLLQVRHKSLVPRRTKYRKAHKGRTPIALGGSTKGTTLEWGDYGIRVNEPVRLTAKHIETAEAALKRGLKPIRGSKVYLRVFPDIPVCIKGNETRMGKGKGTFEFWSCRARVGRVIFEIGGPNLRPEMATAVMKLASSKLPVTTSFITRDTPGRIGFEVAEEAEAGDGAVELVTGEKRPKVVTKGDVERILKMRKEALGVEEMGRAPKVEELRA
ncbi:ribosomal protein L16 [Meredithblackwellia eburnea MCA 4105]